MKNGSIDKKCENTGFYSIKGYLKKVKKETWILLINVILFIFICMVHSLPAGHYVDFNPINGTFQNYNPVRRLLDGQVPYRDFQDYLGLGHLYFGTLFTILYGGDYQASLQAFSFLQFAGLGLCSFVIGKAIFKNKNNALVITNMLLVCVIIRPLFFDFAVVGTDDVLASVTAALGPGNSARFLRGMILPIVILLISLVLHHGDECINDIKRIVKRLIIWTLLGVIAGMAFIWSNDYGISCWLCIAIMSFWIDFCIHRKIGRAIISVIIEMSASIVSIVVMVEVITWGHLHQWFSDTLGTGGYQSWYYNSEKSVYIFDVDFSFIMCIQAGIVILCLTKLFLDKGSIDTLRQYGVIGFANMVCFSAVNEYRLLSGGECQRGSD